MNATRSFAYALAALTGIMFAGEAAAVPMTWTDTYDPADIYMNGSNSQVNYVHDITSDGFTPGTDLVLGGSIEFVLRDDRDRDGLFTGLEFVYLDLPGLLGDAFVEVDYSNVVLGLSLTSIVSLNIDGMLDVTVKRTAGDFYFNESTLTAHGYGPEAVPEPMTLGVLGVGLIGLGFAARRRRLVA